MLQASTLRFLKDLKGHNDKSWFDKNRPAYETAREDFEAFIQAVINKHGKKDSSISGLKAKDCMFRINRDIRFSKDKSPYKTNFGASISRGGKKSAFGGYYFHCEPGGAFAGGGIWMPMPPDLKKLRQEIDYGFDEFEKILGAKKFKNSYDGLSREGDISLSKVPQGFDKESAAADYLKLKSFVALKKISDKELVSKDLVSTTVTAFEALQPLLLFLNRAMET
jgi:uncharacterized protein (TIGR02453 family)